MLPSFFLTKRTGAPQGSLVCASSATDSATNFRVRFLDTKPYLDFLALEGLSDVSVVSLRFFLRGFPGADVGSSYADVTGVETDGLRGALGAVDLGFWASLVGFGAGENRHPKDFSLCSLSTELEISKNMLFIGQVERRVRSWVELVPPLKVMDNQLGEPDTRDPNQSGLLFP
nr:hypothetical protein [Tanacetum cinerariifolium]